MIADSFDCAFEGYIEDVLSGKAVVSNLVRCAVQRHVRDMERQSSSDFPYHFDRNLARKVCRFFPAVLKHTIAPFAKRPFELSPWQTFCDASIFGWLRDDDNTRRFRKSYRSMGRKNGKSTWLAGESIYMGGFDRNPLTGEAEAVSQVVLSATKRDQVNRVVFAEIERMRRHSGAINSRSDYLKSKTEIRFTSNDGEIITTGSDKPYDGLNPHFVVIDELHAWRPHHREFFDTMMTGSGSRAQPLIAIITTAGDDRSHLWREVYDFTSGVVKGVFTDDEYFVFTAELDDDDDPFDESLWIKANPNLGAALRFDTLRQQAVEAKTSAVALNRFKRYHCNRHVTSTSKAFDQQQWDAAKGHMSDWHTAEAIGAGFDIGARDDLAALGFCARFPVAEHDGEPVYRFEVDCKTYIADDTLRDLTQSPFSYWVHGQNLHRCQFPLAELKETLIEKCQTYCIHGVAYDPYNAQQMSEDLTREGITVARMAQNCANFNEAIRDFLKALQDGRIRHNGNPVLSWCVNNASIFADRQDRWMFDKKASAEKIDAIVAVVMAFRICSLAPTRATGSLYL